jgi:hypothetical protein
VIRTIVMKPDYFFKWHQAIALVNGDVVFSVSYELNFKHNLREYDALSNVST